VLVGVFDLAASSPVDLAQRWYRGLALAVESWVDRDPERADHDVAEFVASSEFVNVRNQERRADLLVAVAEGYYKAGRRDRAFEFNQRARDAGSAEAWVQKGLFHVGQEQPREASEAFEQALALDGSREDARSFMRALSGPDTGSATDAPPIRRPQFET
jgi:tetratricopeptide (TPR) repeat protein